MADAEGEDVFRLANMYSISAYDAAYLALAEALDCVVWTADRPFYQAVFIQGTRVRWIGDYQ